MFLPILYAHLIIHDQQTKLQNCILEKLETTNYKLPLELLKVPTKGKAQNNPFMPFEIHERDLTAPIIPSKEQGWSSDNSVDQATILY